MKKTTLILFITAFSVSAFSQELPNITDSRVQIKLPTVKGDSLTLASLKGKVILLDFWASWCGPCRSANKQLVKLYAKYKPQGFEIFSVSVDQKKNDWEKAISKDKITWIQVNDPRGWDAQTAVNWNIIQLPTTYLINKKGDVVSIDLEGKELDEEVKKLLEE
ncbi:MAG TPA: TlpA disulfide reductase family protein [Chitinophagaceae bacterium]|nr:TlpA disulfide reductase family protein [Chitinophagaceae bacterium]